MTIISKARESLRPHHHLQGHRDSIIVLTVAYASETWAWNQAQRSKIHSVEMSYLRGGCGVNRMDGESNENVYINFGMSSRGEGMSCGVVMVKRSTLRWFGHLEGWTRGN